MTLALDPNLPPVLELRSLKPYDRHEVMNLWGRRVGVGIKNTLDMVFDDDASVQGLAITAGESVVGFGVVMFLTPTGVEEYFSTSADGYPIVRRTPCSMPASSMRIGRGAGSARS